MLKSASQPLVANLGRVTPFPSIGRSEQVDLARGISSNYACMNCCPDSFANGWVDPGAVQGFVGDTTQFNGFEQTRNCYGSLNAPFNPWPSWDSSNWNVASCDGSGMATAEGLGTANIQARWLTYEWGSFESGNPNECYERPLDILAEAICDVLASPVTFTTATLGNKTTSFDGGLPRPSVTFSGSNVGLNICGNLGARFLLTVKFTLPDEAVALSDSRSRARGFGGTNDADFGVDWFRFENVDLTSTPKKAEMLIQAFTRSSLPTEPPFNTIQVSVAGDYPAGTFRGEASVKINCP